MSNLFILLKNSFINSTGLILYLKISNSKEKKKANYYLQQYCY